MKKASTVLFIAILMGVGIRAIEVLRDGELEKFTAIMSKNIPHSFYGNGD